MSALFRNSLIINFRTRIVTLVVGVKRVKFNNIYLRHNTKFGKHWLEIQ